jgi:hypothetical protein
MEDKISCIGLIFTLMVFEYAAGVLTKQVFNPACVPGLTACKSY